MLRVRRKVKAVETVGIDTRITAGEEGAFECIQSGNARVGRNCRRQKHDPRAKLGQAAIFDHAFADPIRIDLQEMHRLAGWNMLLPVRACHTVFRADRAKLMPSAV